MEKNKIRQLLIEGLINEITIGDAWTKFYSNKEKYPVLNGDNELFNKINDLYPKKDDNFNKGYFTWLYNLLKSNNLKEEDFYKAKEYLTYFNKFINKISKEDRDINKFKTLGDLYLVVKPFIDGGDNQPTSKSDELRKIKSEEIEKVFENENWLVMIPKTERASCIIGKGTQWCTAAEESDNYFNSYNKQGPLYVIVHKDSSADNKKYQLHFETDSLMDENDRPVAAANFFQYVDDADDLLEFFQGKYVKFWDFILTTSVDYMVGGGYNELFIDAIQSDNVTESVLTDTLSQLRQSYNDEAIMTGFIYEIDPDNIKSYEVEEMVRSENLEDVDRNHILNHLADIGYDFNDTNKDIFGYIKAKQDLSTHNIEIKKTYNIDKGKTLTVNRINFNLDKPYNVNLDKKNGDIKLDTLLNLIHQGQLFDEGVKNNCHNCIMKDFIKAKIRESLITENRVKFDLTIPKDILEISDIFKQNSFKLYIVGGAVRDSLLKKPIKDYDLATDATPDQVEQMMAKAGFRTLPTGKAFGVINVFTDEDEYEIATFRTDSSTGDGRRPDSVEFTTIDQDVKRRDLTINALFFDIDTNEIVDLVGGITDLKNGIVRTVGNPEDRFKEDKLRILRAIRFAGRFGSELEPNVDAALRKDASLQGISPERIRDEFLKGIKTTTSVVHFLKLIDKYKLFDWVFKGLRVNKNLIEERDPAVLLAFLLRDNDPAVLGKVLNQLTYSAAEVKAITFLVAFQQFDNPDDVYIFKKQHMNSGIGEQQLKKFGELINFNKRVLNAFVDFKLSVTGDDAQREMGVKAGPEMGSAIKKMEADNFKSML